jgi:YaiO family outer membrane protein
MMMLLFTALMFLALACHFAFARREWKRSKGKAAGDIDITYVLQEDYLGRSFREKAAQWIADAPKGAVLHDSGRGDGVRLLEDCCLNDGGIAREVIVVRGEFSAGANVACKKEVWVKGNCRFGVGSLVRAMAVDGDLRLGANTQVERWLDCLGSMDVEPGCRLSGRTTCRGEIRLAGSATATSLHAGSIVVLPATGPPDEQAPAQSMALFDGELDSAAKSRLKAVGVNPHRLRRLSPDTWAHSGDLRPSGAVNFKIKLLVRGSCRFAAGSSMEDMKVNGNLEIGAHCHCNGTLVARGNIAIGRHTVLAAPVFSGAAVRLASGVRAGETDIPVAIYGEGKVDLEPGVIVHGKVASAGVVNVAVRQPQGAWLPRAIAAGAETSRSSLRTGIAGAIVALVIAAAPGKAQDNIALERPLPVHVELGGFASHVDRGYGSWRGLEGQVSIRANSFFVPTFAAESQLRPLGRQQSYSFVSYLNWSSTFYTTIGASIAPQNGSPAIYYPRNRQDVKGFVKLGSSRRVVLDAGFTRFDFGAPGRGQIYTAGLLLYPGKAVIEGSVSVNRNQPNNLVSASGLIAAQYGREGHYWVGATAGGGRELYNYVGIAPVDVKLFSYSLHFFYRKWISRHVGFKASLLYVKKLEAYTQSGGTVSMFFEF